MPLVLIVENRCEHSYFVYMYVYVFILFYISFHFIYLFIHLFNHLFFYLFILFIYLFLLIKCVHDRRYLRHECLDYHIIGTSVVNIVCHGHECNILFITVELLNQINIQINYSMFTH